MVLFKKKCEYCKTKIPKGDEFLFKVKIPELKSATDKPFCSEEHAEKYKQEVRGTPRRNFCPSCGV